VIYSHNLIGQHKFEVEFEFEKAAAVGLRAKARLGAPPVLFFCPVDGVRGEKFRDAIGWAVRDPELDRDSSAHPPGPGARISLAWAM